METKNDAKIIRFEIEAGGEKYPCLLTMGVMLDFHETTGKEVYQAETARELLTVAYFCAAAGATVSGKKLPFSLQEFPHVLTPQEGAEAIGAYSAAVIAASGAGPDAESADSTAAEEPGEGKKKAGGKA